MVHFVGKGKKSELKHIEIHLNDHETNKSGKFVNNSVHSTKYTVYNFLHKNLIEQFRRISNVYFLAVAVITLIPTMSPFSPYSAWVPWGFILAVSATKDIAEDIRRWRFDYQINHRLYQIVRDGSIKTIYNENISVGDIVIVNSGEEIPADMVLLSCSNADGMVFLDTANLDGESNMKVHEVLCETQHLNIENVLDFHALLIVKKNTVDLYKFQGILVLSSNKIVLNEKNLILRGCYLRNTDFILGGVVYTGIDTKVQMNSGMNLTKISKTDRIIDRVIIVMFIMKIIICILLSIINTSIEMKIFSTIGIFLEKEESAIVHGINAFWSYFALFSYFIPISLIITLDMVRIIQSVFMEWDMEMMVNGGEGGMNVKNSDLNDELARPSFVLCDKTGTLTENMMLFRRASVNGRVYCRYDEDELMRKAMEDTKEGRWCLKFLISLAIVNTVMVGNGVKDVNKCDDEAEEVVEIKKKDENTIVDNYNYYGQSNDELCLCRYASRSGVILKSRSDDNMVLEVFDRTMKVKILRVIEFTNERRRMSIVVQFENGEIELLSKGSDYQMMSRVSDGVSARLMMKTKRHMDRFNSRGLRTMTFCYKKLDQIEYSNFEKEMCDLMMKGMEKREGEEESSLRMSTDGMNDGGELERRMEAMVNELENGMYLMGCVGMEDKLQRGVPRTIRDLISAGIRVWMVTGDKQATAISIFRSCDLMSGKEYKMMSVTECKVKEEYYERIKGVFEMIVEEGRNLMLLVIDGMTLNHAIRNEGELLDLSRRCAFVIFCSTTPLQKALIIRMLKSDRKNIVLAIGDGANDVSMLREAHIGVAIRGKEGLQAVRASDYSIGSFHHLKRLILIHGRYNLVRSNNVIYFFFYKSLSVFLVMVWYSIFNIFSAQILYDDIIIALFNVIYTSLPPIAFGIFDRDLDEKKISKNPDCHKDVVNHSFHFSTLFICLLNSTWHSLTFFFIPFLLLNPNTSIIISSGKTLTLFEYGSIIFTGAFFTLLLKCILIIHLWNIPILASSISSLLFYFFVLLIQSYWPSFLPHHYHLLPHLFSSPSTIFCVLLIPFTALLPDLTFTYLHRNYWPKKTHILQNT